MLGGNAHQHRATLLASEAVLPREYRAAQVPHNDHSLVTIDPPIDHSVVDLRRQQVQDAPRPEDVLTTDHLTQHGHEQISRRREPLHDQTTPIREHHAFQESARLALVVSHHGTFDHFVKILTGHSDHPSFRG